MDDNMEPIINRVAESDIQIFNLEELWDGAPVRELDLEPFLVEGLVLREREFRQRVKEYEWSQFEGARLAVFCSTDAIVPTWAFMLIASRVKGIVRSVAPGRINDIIRDHYTRALAEVDWERYRDRNVVIKGCGSKLVPTSAYVAATLQLQDVASKLMYGEPCSSVPLWRRPQERKEGAAKAAVRPAKLANLPSGPPRD